MLEGMPAWEYDLWRAEFNRQPWDYTRDDLRAGMQTSALINIQIPKGKPPVKPSMFMPFFKEERVEQSGSDVIATLHGAKSAV
ncbi:phage tail assembly protein T [Hahella ganghwensis]|uniref:phage tail assembly protein T n=1 Tax=Hahella ganghwensis TaxID=286420 RepID=UPI00037A167E|nr:hypothetical protein [Hahella ganghwensis]